LTPGNHFRDGGGDAVARTIELLDASNILHSGFSTTNWDDAASPAVYDVDGFKFAFLGYDDVAWFHWAGPTWGGVATVSQRFENGTKKLLNERIQSNVEKARQVADYVIVVMSWGDREYINWPLEYQKLMGHTFIDSGADLVIGTHQHWVNTVEIYNEKFIFYGMGNFVFDQTHTDPTRQGAIIKFYFFDKRLVSVKIIPHQTCGPQQSLVDDENCNHFQPQILEEDDPVYRQIWDRIFEYSEI
jgi:poly-gamma-glutamate capsule biosynthesis protein CapA/YwtB (metallophosphatase superfamily)